MFLGTVLLVGIVWYGLWSLCMVTLYVESLCMLMLKAGTSVLGSRGKIGMTKRMKAVTIHK